MRVLKGHAAEVEGGAVGNILEDRRGALASKLLAAALRFQDSPGDEEHACAGFEGLDGGLVGEMGEEAQRHGDVSEDAGAVAVAKNGGRAAGIDIGEEAEA